MSTTAQSPLVAAAATAAPVRRLRDSCNRCAASKIKCSKEKPCCARCAKQGKVCEYFATKRAGRKPGNRAQNSTSPPVTQAWMPATLSEPTDRHPSPIPPSTESYSDFFSAGFVPSDPTIPATEMDVLNFQIDDFQSTSLSLPMLELPDGDDLDALLASSHEPSVVEVTTPAARPADIQYGPGVTCHFARALGLLKDLPSPSTLCSPSVRTPSGHAPTIYSVINCNEQAVEAISEMLQCDCTDDGHLLAILAIIVLKILTWYAVVVRQTPNIDAESAEWGFPSVDQPIQKRYAPEGKRSYGVDSDDHVRLTGQQILSQLHRVQRLVNTLSQRFQCVGGRDGAPPTPPFDNNADLFTSIETMFPFPISIFDQMQANLRKRLRDLSAEIMDLLR